MRTLAYWICNVSKGNLGIMPRPRGGKWLEEEIDRLKREGVDVLVSLLTKPEIEEWDLTREPDLCAANRIHYINFPIEDRSIPTSTAAFDELVQSLLPDLLSGKSVVIHCHGGIGRSGLTAACILIAHGRTAEAACLVTSIARRCEVPDTEQQRRWVESWATHHGSRSG